MSKQQETVAPDVWQEMNNKCDEIITKIVEKKKRQTKKQKQAAASATK